jgi:hypothetical protein
MLSIYATSCDLFYLEHNYLLSRAVAIDARVPQQIMNVV